MRGKLDLHYADARDVAQRRAICCVDIAKVRLQ